MRVFAPGCDLHTMSTRTKQIRDMERIFSLIQSKDELWSVMDKKLPKLKIMCDTVRSTLLEDDIMNREEYKTTNETTSSNKDSTLLQLLSWFKTMPELITRETSQRVITSIFHHEQQLQNQFKLIVMDKLLVLITIQENDEEGCEKNNIKVTLSIMAYEM